MSTSNRMKLAAALKRTYLESVARDEQPWLALADVAIAMKEGRYVQPAEPGDDSWKDLPVDRLEISVLGINCLRGAGLLTAGAVDEAADGVLLRIPSLGRRTFGQIRSAIARVKNQ